MTRKIIYMNNAATGFPKFAETIMAVNDALVKGDVFSNRDSIDVSNVGMRIFGLRTQISQMIGATEPHNICLTCSDTLALNMLIQGLDIAYEKPVIIYTTPYEHNSVSSPLAFMTHGYPFLKVREIPFKNGQAHYDKFKQIIKEDREFGYDIAAAVCSHGSNVTGDVIDTVVLGRILYENNIPFILDAAQTLGFVPINVEKSYISALAFAGHKGLNGPQGTGGFYIRDSFSITPILFGGTGNNSGEIEPPIVRPDAFEVGTPAIHDLLGLSAAIDVIVHKIGKKEYRTKVLELTQVLHDGLVDIPNVIVYGKDKKKTPVVAFNVKGYDCFSVGEYLAKHDVICRIGVHCSAYTMKNLDLEEYGGSVRLSLGYSNSMKEVKHVLELLHSFASVG